MSELGDIKHAEEVRRGAVLTEKQKADLYQSALVWAFKNIPEVAERLTPRYCKAKEARLLAGLVKSPTISQ